MARARSPNRDKAFEIYKDHDGDIKLIDIAKELNIKDSQIRKWKSQDSWDEKLKGALPISKSNVTNQNENKTNIKKDIKEPIVEEVNEVIQNAELTDKQRLFCIYYIERFNATWAYQKAYECDHETARRCGSRLLTNVDVKIEVKRLTDECLEEQEVEAKLIYKRIFQLVILEIIYHLKRFVKINGLRIKIVKILQLLIQIQGNKISLNIIRLNLKIVLI